MDSAASRKLTNSRDSLLPLQGFIPFELAFNFVPVFERSNILSKLNIQIYF